MRVAIFNKQKQENPLRGHLASLRNDYRQPGARGREIADPILKRWMSRLSAAEKAVPKNKRPEVIARVDTAMIIGKAAIIRSPDNVRAFKMLVKVAQTETAKEARRQARIRNAKEVAGIITGTLVVAGLFYSGQGLLGGIIAAAGIATLIMNSVQDGQAVQSAVQPREQLFSQVEKMIIEAENKGRIN